MRWIQRCSIMFTATTIAVTLKQWRWRVLAILVGLALVLLVSLTRIYLGAHYLSDVLGASAAGAAWLAFCLTAIGTIRRYRLKTRTR